MSTVADGTSTKKSGPRIPGFAQLQRLGKSLMLPIALLPWQWVERNTGEIARFHPRFGPEWSSERD